MRMCSNKFSAVEARKEGSVQCKSHRWCSVAFPAALVLFLAGCFSAPSLIARQRVWNERQDTATKAEATVVKHGIGLVEDSTYCLVYRFEAQQSDGTTRTVVKAQGVEEEFYHQTPDGTTVAVVFASVNPDNVVIEGTDSNPTFGVVLAFLLSAVGFLYCSWLVLSAIRLALVERKGRMGSRFVYLLLVS